MDELFEDISVAERAFQLDIRAFLEANLTPQMRDAARFTMWKISEFEYGRQWQKILNAHGYGAIYWPVEYGGKDWTQTQKLIWTLENLRAGAPDVMNMGRDLAAPVIMEFGTDEQKRTYLPAILSGDDWWAQGFSEPGAGSDLASLSLAAVTDGDDFVLNGSKIWTTYAQHANRIFCLVRSSHGPKKQNGISFLLIDTDTPGIQVRPLHTIAGDHEFNQVFFTDVRVSKTRLLGAEDDGWTVVRYLLQYEHGGISSAAAEHSQRFELLKEIAGLEEDGLGVRLIENVEFVRRMAEVLIDVQAVAYAEARMIAAVKSGGPPSPLGELMAVRSREVGQKINALAARAIGVHALPFQKRAREVNSGVQPIGPEHALTPMPYMLAQRAATIAGGTPDIHRNNIAKHLLRL